jgi:hypothetical protein
MPFRMPSWRSNRPGRGGAIAWLLLLALALPAGAQVGPPVRLQPPPSPGTGPTVPMAPAAAAPLPAPDTDGSIKATPLAPVDASWIGALPDDAGPLPQTMWQGTPRALVAAALPLLAPTTSPALQELSRRLLLSNAVAPLGDDGPDRPSLAQLRVERLIALGEIDGALAVLEALPPTTRGDALDHRRVDLLFAKNDVPAACRQVQDGVARYQGLWWDRALIACQALAGDREQTALGLGLLREQKAPPDPVFDALVNAAGGRAMKLDKLPEPTPILVTLAAAAKLPLPADAVNAADLPSLRAWVGNPAVPPLQRVAAGERAAMLGAIPPGALAELYAKVEVKPDELGAAIKQSKAPVTPRDRALLYQVARTDPASAARAAALQALLAEAKKRGAFITMARVVAPILLELAPSEDLRSFAPDAVRALLAAGRSDAVTPWLTYVDSFVPTTLIALGRTTEDKPKQAIAVGNSGSPDSSPRPSQFAMLFALRSALGEDASAESWIPLYVAGPHDATVPGIALWLDQQRAATDKRVGETVLTSLILARAGERLTGEPIVLARVVAGLKLVGLEREARALAVEAALDAGL